jgi:hypothetical protein
MAPRTREFANDVKFLKTFGQTYERLRRENVAAATRDPAVARELAKHMRRAHVTPSRGRVTPSRGRVTPSRGRVTSPLPRSPAPRRR